MQGINYHKYSLRYGNIQSNKSMHISIQLPWTGKNGASKETAQPGLFLKA